MSRKRRPRSRRRRRRAKEKAYPSPAERQRIIKRRDKLLKELTTATFMHPGDNRRIDRLVRRYDPHEVMLVLNVVQKRTLSAEFIGDESMVYREYRRAFARFGGDRPFLSMQQHGELSFEHAKLHAEREFKSVVHRRPSPREQELYDLLLIGVDFWEDITPPAVPPRPDDFGAPSPGEYGYPARTLFTWGWDVDEQRVIDNAKNITKWWPAVPDLARMALDEGLLDGWPGEPASWACYHALHLLGHLRAHQVAGQLLPLFDLEDDWISDRLAVVWGRMGPQAEPPLWDYVDDRGHDAEQRGIVMLGLAAIAEHHPERRTDIVDGLAQRLRRASADDAEANAYIVHVLDRMQAVEAADVISEAFEQHKVDESIVLPYNVDLLQDGED